MADLLGTPGRLAALDQPLLQFLQSHFHDSRTGHVNRPLIHSFVFQ
jgi:hypothetical protein